MSDFTDFLENELLDHAFRNSAYTPPAAVYLGLFTAAPSDAGGGTEVSTGGYARQAITFGAASGGVIANTSAVAFTASGANYGTVGWVGVFSASTSGNLMAWKAISAVAVSDGETQTFPIGDLTIALD